MTSIVSEWLDALMLRRRAARLRWLIPGLPEGLHPSTFKPLRSWPGPQEPVSLSPTQTLYSCHLWSRGQWWTDASPSQRSRCLGFVRCYTKKLTGCYWFPLLGDSLYTWRAEWGHGPAFRHILRVYLLKLHPLRGLQKKEAVDEVFPLKSDPFVS